MKSHSVFLPLNRTTGHTQLLGEPRAGKTAINAQFFETSDRRHEVILGSTRDGMSVPKQPDSGQPPMKKED